MESRRLMVRSRCIGGSSLRDEQWPCLHLPRQLVRRRPPDNMGERLAHRRSKGQREMGWGREYHGTGGLRDGWIPLHISRYLSATLRLSGKSRRSSRLDAGIYLVRPNGVRQSPPAFLALA